MWGKFFLYGSLPEKQAFIEELAKLNRGISMAVTVLKNISNSELNWYHETRYWMHISDEKTMIASAEDRGLKKGIRQTTIKNAIALLKDGYSPEKIARCLE